MTTLIRTLARHGWLLAVAAGLCVAGRAAVTKVPVRPHRTAAQQAARPVTPKSKAQGSKGQGSKGQGSKGQGSKGQSSGKSHPAGKAIPHGKSRRKKLPEMDPADAPVMQRARRGVPRVKPEVRGLALARGRAQEFAPAPLRGSRDILVHQNLMADDEGLERIQDDDDLERLRAERQLVDLPEGRGLLVNPELPEGRRCARPWTVRFATDTARAFYARFGQPLEVNSAARSVAYQQRLARVNGNAAGTEGEVASPHLTGQAIDLGKRGMSRAQLAWMRSRLQPLMAAGKIDVEEEFRQACFHISVYRSYLPLTVADVQRAGGRE